MALSSDSNTLLSISGLEVLADARIGIVATEWNDQIIAEQIKGCTRILQQVGVTSISHYIVPGAFEIPFACKQVAATEVDAIIAFAAVIRGGTPHFEYVSQAVTQGIGMLNTQLDIPIIFGILTLDTEAQAWERLGGIHGHKGEEAAIAALKMIQFKRVLNTVK